MKKPGKLRVLQDSGSYEDQFRNIYRSLFQDLYIYAISITRSDDLAKDAVAEVFVRLWDSKDDLSRIKEIKSYLLTSVKNECIKSLYQRKRQDDIDIGEQIEKISPEDILLEKELKEFIDRIVSTLPEQCQLIFKMNNVDQMSYKEIAAELNITTSTVGTQITRAIRLIRSELLDHYSTGSDKKKYLMKSIIPIIFCLLP
tara:strand:- start:3423 stop:4022 length:600 start_codon:yes stop_codon:yes gene_type:complete